jgi:hypothetical protein
MKIGRQYATSMRLGTHRSTLMQLWFCRGQLGALKKQSDKILADQRLREVTQKDSSVIVIWISRLGTPTAKFVSQ